MIKKIVSSDYENFWSEINDQEKRFLRNFKRKNINNLSKKQKSNLKWIEEDLL